MSIMRLSVTLKWLLWINYQLLIWRLERGLMNSSGWLWNCLAQAPLPSLITADERQHFAQQTSVLLPPVDWSRNEHLTQLGQSESFSGIFGFETSRNETLSNF